MRGLGGRLAGCRTGKRGKGRQESSQFAGEKSRHCSGSSDRGEMEKGGSSKAFVNRTSHGLVEFV